MFICLSVGLPASRFLQHTIVLQKSTRITVASRCVKTVQDTVMTIYWCVVEIKTMGEFEDRCGQSRVWEKECKGPLSLRLVIFSGDTSSQTLNLFFLRLV